MNDNIRASTELRLDIEERARKIIEKIIGSRLYLSASRLGRGKATIEARQARSEETGGRGREVGSGRDLYLKSELRRRPGRSSGLMQRVLLGPTLINLL